MKLKDISFIPVGVGIAIVLTEILSSGFEYIDKGYKQKRQEQEESVASISDLYDQAVAISAGEDNYWSTKEKAQFLKESGLDVVLQDSDNLFFQADSGMDMADVYSSTRHNPYKHLGTIPRSRLEAYIQAHQKAEAE